MTINNIEIHGVNNAYTRIRGLNIKNLRPTAFYIAELYINSKTGNLLVHYVDLMQDVQYSIPFLQLKNHENYVLVTTFSQACEEKEFIQVLKTYIYTRERTEA